MREFPKIDTAKVLLEIFIQTYSEFFFPKNQKMFYQFSEIPATPWNW